jgi:hypothetical protein
MNALADIPVFDAGLEPTSLRLDDPDDFDLPSTSVRFTRTRFVGRPANDNHVDRRPQDRQPGESAGDWMIRLFKLRPTRPPQAYRAANRRSPLEDEHSAGRVRLAEMEVADEVERLANAAASRPRSAHPRSVPAGQLNGAELNAHAAGILRRLRLASGHLWWVVDEVAVRRQMTMRQIGEACGCTARDTAATVGREKAIDGLKLVGAEMDRLWEAGRRAA